MIRILPSQSRPHAASAIVENNIAEKMESGFHFLSYEERQSLRGTLGEEFDIPLQTMSKQYESEGEV